jgi:hypothetical protein
MRATRVVMACTFMPKPQPSSFGVVSAIFKLESVADRWVEVCRWLTR